MATDSGKKKSDDLSRKLLICDDDAVTAKVLGATFEQAGFNVDVAEDAEAALAKLDEKEFGVMIFDLNLLGMNGVKLIDAVREHESNGNARIMVYSGRTGLRDISLCFRQGANAYVAKPCDKTPLLEVVERMRSGEDRMVRLADDEVKPGTSRLEVRKFDRYPAPSSLGRIRRETEATARHQASLEDVSAEGARVIVKSRFGLGEKVYLRCQIFQPFEFEVAYEVVHVAEETPGEYSLGLRLTGDLERMRERLQRIISKSVAVPV